MTLVSPLGCPVAWKQMLLALAQCLCIENGQDLTVELDRGVLKLAVINNQNKKYVEEKS